MVSMERDYYYPKVADRDEPAVWQERGAKDHWQRARARVDTLLENQPSYLAQDVDQAIRAAYPIRDDIPSL